MGTDLDLAVDATEGTDPDAVVAVLAEEARRLADVFTVFDADSELCRWRRGEVDRPSADLEGLLRCAASWQRVALGGWHPLTGVLSGRWERAVAAGAAPPVTELAALAEGLAGSGIVADADGVHQVGRCEGLDLNGLAKGYVVDRVLETAFARFDVERVVVNAGGDLRQRGGRALRVGVEDPLRPYDNAAPLTVIEVADAAVATSGAARRWFQVGDRRWSKVLDPRSGQPVTHTAGATVVAPDAASADVLATVCSVLDVDEWIELIDRLDDASGRYACLVVLADGHQVRSAGFGALEGERRTAAWGLPHRDLGAAPDSNHRPQPGWWTGRRRPCSDQEAPPCRPHPLAQRTSTSTPTAG